MKGGHMVKSKKSTKSLHPNAEDPRIRIEIFGRIRIQLNTDPKHWLRPGRRKTGWKEKKKIYTKFT